MKKINLKFNKDNILPITLIGVLVFIFIMVIFTGVSYAYWQKNYAQKSTNKIKSGCFSFELTDENPINLANCSLFIFKLFLISVIRFPISSFIIKPP